MTVSFLNLPALSDSMFTVVKEFANSIEPDRAGQEWIQNFHNNQIHAVSHVYGKPHAFLSQELQQELNQIYYPYFQQSIMAIVAKFENLDLGIPAQSPPHCDRYRQTAINYIIQTGGPEVRTCFYQQSRRVQDLSQAENAQYHELDLESCQVIPERTWHVYDVQKYHSVENILTSRLIFSLVLEHNPDLVSFTTQYSKLLQK